uniref:ANK_REP_REGION domain-containing protein n=1 Tax=Macrostomum lignano TaxID=282301 RepID=A0A1I8FIN5_9PLAT
MTLHQLALAVKSRHRIRLSLLPAPAAELAPHAELCQDQSASKWLDYVVHSRSHKAPKSASLEADRLTADQDITYCNSAPVQPYYVTCGPGRPAPAPSSPAQLGGALGESLGEQSGLIASNPIYSLVDIYGGGCLVDCYDNARSRRCPARLSRRINSVPTISRTAAQKCPNAIVCQRRCVFDNNIKHLVCWDITKRGIYGADIHQRAAGDFFQPDDQRWIKKAKANQLSSPEIYDYLIVSGADPSNRDQLGNSVLHMLVIHNQ